MSLTQALNTASSGLKVTQSAMSIVASNVANAQTPGYVRKSLQVASTASSNAGSSVRIAAVQRELDAYLQKQLRVESAGGSYADLRADLLFAPAGDLWRPEFVKLARNPCSTASPIRCRRW